MSRNIFSIGTIICILYFGSLTAQPQQKLNIDGVTVFLRGAELTSSAKISLVKGENEILFTNMAGDAYNQSINVSANNGVVVEGATYQNNYLGENLLTPHAKIIEDSIEMITGIRKLVLDKLTVINEEIAVLFNNKKVSGDNTGLSVTELTKLLDLYSTRYEGYLNQKGKQEELLKKTDEHLLRLNQQWAEEQKKGVQPGGNLLVKFYAKEAAAASVVIDYVVPNAGWTPAYDIMADTINVPVKLVYKANIYQSSGVNWNNVKLTLSTGNPNEGVNAPALNPWYLAFYIPQPSPGVAGLNDTALLFSTMGRNAKSMQMDAVEIMDPITGYEQPKVIRHEDLPVAVDNGGVNTTFDIDLPFTIPCDGKEHLVAVKRYEMAATYRYFAVPKLDKDVFLQAQVTHWEDLNLLPGTTNIFYEGTFVGQGNLDVRTVKDTFTISLGRDKKIVVKRDRDTQRRSVKTIGANVREEFAYSLTIRNTRKENISLTIQDQLPVSNDKDIVLEDLDYGGAATEVNTGQMTWNVQLNPSETKKMEFGFTVKYPKGKTINNLR